MDVDALKKPSDAPPVLNTLMRLTCTRIELLSTVGAATVGSETSRLKSTGNAPRGERNVQLDELRTAYREACCNWDRLKVVGDAQQALHRATGNSVGLAYADGRKRRTLAWKLAVATDARASTLVGADFGCSAVYVRKLRMQYARQLDRD